MLHIYITEETGYYLVKHYEKKDLVLLRSFFDYFKMVTVPRNSLGTRSIV